MTSGTIVAIIIVVVVLAVVVAIAAATARRRRLQQQFGPEYDRAVVDHGSRREAEAELAERERRVRELDIRPLEQAELDRYMRQWTAIQEQFVDTPAHAVTSAQTLITAVMSDRGYPTENADQIMADLSVDHAGTLEQFRTAQQFAARATDGSASTEDLRLAMVHYRAMFRDLLGEPVDTTAQPAETTAETAAPATVPDVEPADAKPVPAYPNGASEAPTDDDHAPATDGAAAAPSARLPRER
jgi:hypothetical protein